MIRVQDLWKVFKLYRSPADRLKEIVFRRPYHREFVALRGVSFQVADGQSLGIVGPNGAGKSTLLKILTGVLLPDRGQVEVSGRITGLLELGTGFNPEMSGRQNIFLNGTLLGMSREEIEAKLKEIIAFSELEDFIDEPLKTYSSGMVMRLAFSVAIHADPRCFVVDEALAVGDAYFQQKCIRRIRDFKASGGSIVFVSHDLNAVKILCDQALLLDQGQVLEIGDPERIINLYHFLLAKKAQGQGLEINHLSRQRSDYGDYTAQIEEVRLLGPDGQETEGVVSGQSAVFEVRVKAHQPQQALTMGLLIRDRFGQDLFGTNTFYLQRPLRFRAGESKVVRWRFAHLNLGPGSYTLTLALHLGETHLERCCHWVDRALKFEVFPGQPRFIGLVRLEPELEVLEHVGETRPTPPKEKTPQHQGPHRRKQGQD